MYFLFLETIDQTRLLGKTKKIIPFGIIEKY
jgi:hypothetical protein